MRSEPTALFPALLKHYRAQRGMSQLDLALAADVSARHVSFLETGRAQPSREMVLRLATTLAVPLREQNQLLTAAGLPEAFREVEVGALASGPVGRAIDTMFAHHEPLPMVAMSRSYDVVRMNRGATAVLGRFVADPTAIGSQLNGFHALFDPRLLRPAVRDFAQVARAMLSRLHREALERPNDRALGALLTELKRYPDVPADWHVPDFAAPSQPVLPVVLERDGLRLAFLTTLTMFSAPQNITLEELRIESYYPLDDETRRGCAALCGD